MSSRSKRAKAALINNSKLDKSSIQRIEAASVIIADKPKIKMPLKEANT